MDYYYFNTDGISIDGPPRFQTLISKGFAATGGERSYGEQLGQLVPGDTLLMYENGIGVVAFGTVLEPWDRQSHSRMLYYVSSNEVGTEGFEYRIKVNWFLDLSDTPIGIQELKDRIGFISSKPVQKIVEAKNEVARIVAERRTYRSRPPRSDLAQVSAQTPPSKVGEGKQTAMEPVSRMTFAEVAGIFEGLPAVRDERAPPDSLRRGQFRAGWEDATVRGEVYREDTLNRLTWHNLGYRFGAVVGPSDAEEIDAVYEHLAQLYDDIRPDGLSGLPGEFADGSTMVEGAACRVTVNAYERNREAVRRCKAARGTSCVICGFDFRAVYGAEFAGFIHVHHLRLLSKVGREYVVDPVEDLCPVCPNCHAVIHHGGRLRSIEEVKQLLEHRKQEK
jgi:hypothetical protein